MELEDILNGQAPEETPVVEAEAVETPPEPQAEETPGQPRDEHGRFAPKGEQTAPAPEPVEAAPPAAKNEPPPGLLEERRKRQEAELERDQYRQAFERFQQQQAQPQPQPIPSVYEDENGYTQAVMQHAAQIARQQLMPEIQQVLVAQRRDMQEAMARTRYPDWEEKARVFLDQARTNPALFDLAQRQDDMAEFAYRYGKNALEVQQIGSLDIETIKAKAVEEYLAKTAAPAPAAPPPQIPTSLADTQSARPQGQPLAPPTLDQILNGR